MHKRACRARFAVVAIALALTVASQSVSRAAGAVDAGAVWAPGEEVTQMLSGACVADQPDCLPDRMAAAGASPEAVAFARELQGEGYLEAFSEHGRVDVATGFFPFYANSNWRQFLVNGEPQLIDLNDWERLEAIDLATSKVYRKIAKRRPAVTLWPDAQFAGAEALAGEGQRFLFDYPLVDGCHACDLLGYARIAYDFDAKGRLTAVQLVGVEVP
jgi:hypothetical protein